MKFIVLIGALGLAAGCASPPGPAPSSALESALGPATAVPAEASGPEAVVAGGDEEVCKRMKVMGSIRPQRVCASAAEWAAREAQDEQNASDFDRDRRAADGVRSFE